MQERTGRVEPLAQAYTVVLHNADNESYIEGCGMARLDNGALIAAVPVVPRFLWSKERRTKFSRTHMMSSGDGGDTWRRIAELPYYSACPWVYEDKLYLFANKGGTDYRNDDLLLLSSSDGGQTWSDPVTLFAGHFWNCHTGMVIRGSTLYWAVDDLGLGPAYESPNVPPGARRAPRAIAGDLARGPMDPKSWRMSNPVPFPGMADNLGNAKFDEKGSHYLEPNVIDVQGRLRMLATVKLRGQTTANLCALLELSEWEGGLNLSFVQYAPMPGGQLKFCVVWDEISRMFWATANVAADSQRVCDWRDSDDKDPDKVFPSIPGGDDRRFLLLFYGLDGLNWFQAGCVAMADRLTQSFMYAKPVIDGADLAIISRTCVNAPNRHDADYATFHRVRDFRQLALNLYPEG